ncbi:enoyl-CoA hydratase [Gordonia paraffinivorans]|uniref:enoyl-CoA hydratase/isomerase family protein n=1 Tax=Gordonia paraffinivorans TaxID=175628 RepID=UPI000D6192FA|nr:enoyl-CoA hydratase/isomerase family protein [Gordonia paraffinivorans]MBY4575460.1 enoyl-CoA hydratase [Gordonia paraffinivorans]PWD41356.1 enoyl-CoA hydratase [Gordonia paraffinivorans]
MATTAPVPTTDTVRTTVHGGVGVITLDRVTALNALTTEMVDAIDDILSRWESTGLHAVVLDSASPKAFCAGGDIRAIQENSLAGDADASERFFATEYRLNARIASYPIPFVSLIDGICMGGGMGLSIHGAFRVVTDNAVLSMPETGIGFFPDVGASYFLSRLPGALGTYLGLTGIRLSAADALYAGLATHYLDRETLAVVPAVLADHPTQPVEVTLRTLAGASPVADSALARHRGDIDWCFGADTLGAITERLSTFGGDWAEKVRQTLSRLSPQSLQLTFDLLAWGRQHTLRECLDVELAVTRDVIRTPDFIEGVRAALVDKDRAPQWGVSRFVGLEPDGHPLWT